MVMDAFSFDLLNDLICDVERQVGMAIPADHEEMISAMNIAAARLIAVGQLVDAISHLQAREWILAEKQRVEEEKVKKDDPHGVSNVAQQFRRLAGGAGSEDISANTLTEARSEGPLIRPEDEAGYVR